MTRRLFSLLLTLVLLLSMAPTFGITARAAETYNSSKAISYAKKHWNDGKGLCAEFISDCLAAGGITIPNKSCYSSTTASYENNRGTLGKYTNPYLSSAPLLLYLSERYEVITDPEMSEIALGDIVFLIGGNSGNKRDGHVGIIIKIEDGEPIYAAHNNDTNSGRFYPNSNPCTYVVKMSQPKDGSGGSNDSGGAGDEQVPSCDCDISYAGTYICTTESTNLRIRGGHGTKFDVVGTIPKGAEVQVTKASDEWAHVVYNNIQGYASMDYLTLKTPATFTVHYDANGGTGGPDDQTKVAGTALTLSTTVPTRAGHTFQGWATSKDGAVAYQKGGSYTENANITLYAVWKINGYTVTYDANGGSGAPANQTKTYGTALALSTTIPTRAGHTFQGWATSKDGAVAYQKGGSYTENANITLYAVWKINGYTVTYDANGGSGAPANQTKTYGTALALSTTIPTRTGYTFQGWATSKDGAVAYQKGGSYTENANITLYAVWSPKIYTISYSSNGGSGAPLGQTKTYGTAVLLSKTTPTRTGHTFQGWATSENGKPIYRPGDSYTANENVILYAVWNINSYTVTYDANGGRGAPSSQTKTHGTALTLGTTVPTRAGYTFQGWATSKDGAVAYQPGGEITAEKEVTLYAVWQRNKKSFGDADGDGYVDAFDAALIMKYSVGTATGSDLNLSVCDLDGDGYVDAYDAALAQKYSVGLLEFFPIEQQ